MTTAGNAAPETRLAGRRNGLGAPVARNLQTSFGHATGVRGVGLSETPSLRCQFSSSCPHEKADRALVSTGRPAWGCSHPRDLNRYTFSRLPLIPGGTRLGIYEVTALIGEGGMGLVYRARDTKLNRDVALKVLPDSFASDRDRLARFTREAQTLASLNHPNIAHIHGLEESGSVPALVMELVEGDDLARRIAKGALPTDEALTIARQIADALEAAHEQGIVHRDLKPANIKVRSDGTVKVLDFGLAKALAPAGAGATADVTSSPTITAAAMTHAGMIFGTAAYMSPEQAKGRPADKRSDIWAFGCVLFEMLTGKRPFDGADVSDTLAAVLRAEPDWNALPANTPRPIRTLLRRCLEKDRKRRLADAADARLELDDAPTEQPVAPLAAVTKASVARRAGHRHAASATDRERPSSACSTCRPSPGSPLSFPTAPVRCASSARPRAGRRPSRGSVRCVSRRARRQSRRFRLAISKTSRLATGSPCARSSRNWRPRGSNWWPRRPSIACRIRGARSRK